MPHYYSHQSEMEIQSLKRSMEMYQGFVNDSEAKKNEYANRLKLLQ